MNLAIWRMGRLFQAAEPVEGHGAPAEVPAAFEAVGRALERYAAIGTVVVAIAQEAEEPEE